MRRKIIAIIASWFIAIITLTPMASAVTIPIYNNYVALGDSVAAGAGLSDSQDTCDRSTQSYPYLIADQLGTNVNHLACSGAKVDEGIYGEQERDGMELTPQIDQAFANGTPDLITMTIGANDARWVQYLRKCHVATCGTTFDNTSAKVLRGDLRVELYWALNRIEQMSDGNPPTVLLNGYYNAFNGRICQGTEQITSTERSWTRARTADLNQAIRSVTRWFSFAHYVPVSFAGHEMCSTEPWVQDLNDPAPFHPTAAGQVVIADANLRALD